MTGGEQHRGNGEPGEGGGENRTRQIRNNNQKSRIRIEDTFNPDA